MIIPATTEQEKRVLLAYLCDKIGADLDELIGAMPYEIVSVTRNGRGVGAVLYTNFRGTTIEMGWAGEPGWATRANLRTMFWYPFVYLGALTALGTVDKRNEASREFCRRIGCREVGSIENVYGEKRDAILYTMARNKCRWIKDLKHVEAKGTEAARSLQGRRGPDQDKHRYGKESGAVGDDKHDRASGLSLIRH